MHNASTNAPDSDELVPAGHGKQNSLLLAPIVLEYLPGVQSVHFADADRRVYFPATQSLHALDVFAPGLSFCLPGAQAWHVSLFMPARTMLYFPESQSTHSELPVTLFHVPDMHTEHVSPSGPVVMEIKVRF